MHYEWKKRYRNEMVMQFQRQKDYRPVMAMECPSQKRCCDSRRTVRANKAVSQRNGNAIQKAKATSPGSSHAVPLAATGVRLIRRVVSNNAKSGIARQCHIVSVAKAVFRCHAASVAETVFGFIRRAVCVKTVIC